MFALIMTRNDLQKLSRIRVKEARVLLTNGCFPGAYYLAGYAVECALKACIAKQVGRYDFPDKKLANDSFTHNLNKLITTTGLRHDLENEMQGDPDFERNWSVIKEWSEQARYDKNVSEAKARELYSACAGRRHGVLSWLKKYW